MLIIVIYENDAILPINFLLFCKFTLVIVRLHGAVFWLF